MEDFADVNADDKLNLIMAAINKINTNFHYKFEALNKTLVADKEGVVPRLKIAELNIEEMQARVDDMEAETAKIPDQITKLQKLEESTAKLSDEVATLKGLVQVQDMDLKECKKKIVDLTARSMSNNIIITGIVESVEGDQEETDVKCKEKVLAFFRNQMALEVDDNQVDVAHRLGKINQAQVKPRLMIARCTYTLKETVLKNSARLKEKTNSKGDPFYVRPQLPEPLLSEKIEREDRLHSIRRSNALLKDDEQHKKVYAQIKNRTLYINKVAQKQHIQSPSVQDIFNMNVEDENRMEDLTIKHTEAIVDKGSVFRGHALKVHNSREVRLAYAKLRLLFPESNHIILSYAVKTYTGFNDNGEYGAGKRILKILENSKKSNVAVFVTREYGGTHLGPRRFVHIEKVARDALFGIAA